MPDSFLIWVLLLARFPSLPFMLGKNGFRSPHRGRAIARTRLPRPQMTNCYWMRKSISTGNEACKRLHDFFPRLSELRNKIVPAVTQQKLWMHRVSFMPPLLFIALLLDSGKKTHNSKGKNKHSTSQQMNKNNNIAFTQLPIRTCISFMLLQCLIRIHQA